MDTTGKEQRQDRIPIRFIDDEGTAGAQSEGSSGQTGDGTTEGPSSKGIGQESSYEDETEVSQRIDEGSRDKPDEQSEAPPLSDTPEQREDQERFGVKQVRSQGDAENPRSASPLHGSDPNVGPAIAELVATRAELKRVEAENAELRETLARRQADFENFRKRIERERSESYNRVVGEVAGKLLPVVDNIRRALDAESSLRAGESEEFGHFLNGVELIARQLSEVMLGLGVQPIESVGKPFDPHLHEAVATEVNEEVEPDTVLQELVQGYVIGEKLLRPAVVKVSVR
jgi:molecular chaperone GrpE